MVWITDNHMIEHVDLEQLPGANQIARHFDVRLGRSGVTARMIVHDHNGYCSCRNRDTKHFSGMHHNGVHRAVTDEVMSANSRARVQNQHDEAFAFRVVVRSRYDVHSPIVSGAVRGVAQLHVLREWTVAQGDELPFLRMI